MIIILDISADPKYLVNGWRLQTTCMFLFQAGLRILFNLSVDWPIGTGKLKSLNLPLAEEQLLICQFSFGINSVSSAMF